MDGPFTIPVVRHVQKGTTCYLGHMTAEQSKILTFADHYPPKPEEGRLGYQRVPTPRRAKAFAGYLQHNDAGFMTPILLNARHDLDFVTTSDQGHGVITLRPGQRLAKIDGQHRGMGVEEFQPDLTFPVPFMLFERLADDVEQQLFVMINREQKRVSMSHVLYVHQESDEHDELTSIAMRLSEDDRSPWYRRINVIAATGTGLSVTLQGIRDGLELLLGSGRAKLLSEDQKYMVAATFWRAVADTWPDAWQQPKKHALTKAIGLLGLSKSGSYIVLDCLTNSDEPDDVIDAPKLQSIIARAKAVDWSTTGQFEGFGGRGGADRVSDTLDKYFFGGPIA